MKYKLDDIANFGNGKKKPNKDGKIPIYGGNGILGFTDIHNANNAIIIGRVGAYCGSLFYEKGKCWVSDNAIWCKNKEKIDIVYLYYLLKTLNLNARHIGTGQPLLTQDILKRIECNVVELKCQKFIAKILTDIDAKIELNNKINDNLHSQLDSLFYEFWNEKKLIKNVEWKQKRLGDLVDIKRGGSPRPIADYISDSGYSWLKISDVTSVESPYIWSIKEHIKEEGLKKTVFLKAGNLVLSNSATPGIPKIIGLDTCIHDGWLYFINSKLSNYFLYLLFRNIRTKLISFSNGSIFNNLKTDIVKNYIIDYPGFDVLNQFDNLVYPLFEGLKVISVENAKLIELRDTLLPKLMSGEIDVSNIKLDL